MNPQVTPGNLKTLDEILSHVATDFCGGTPPDKLGHPKNRIAKDLWSGVAGLRSAIPFYNAGKGYQDPIPPFPDREYSHAGWEALIRNELHAFNCRGNAYITRISECLIKTMGLINILQGGNKAPRLSLYRGQCNAAWPVISSIGRKVPKGVTNKITEVSNFELQALAKWQDRIQKDTVLLEEIFGQRIGVSPWRRCLARWRSTLPWPRNDGRWWALKQHYDDDDKMGGSRLIDLTSSPLCGLYFACIDWDGNIDESVDGALWVLSTPPGRRFADKDYVSELDDYDPDFDDVAGETIHNYFCLDRHADVVRTVLSHHENQRSLAQDGYFIFSGRFNEPLQNWYGQKPFCFVVPGEFKKGIARELYRVGYTPRKIIRGPKGRLAHDRLTSILRAS